MLLVGQFRLCLLCAIKRNVHKWVSIKISCTLKMSRKSVYTIHEQRTTTTTLSRARASEKRNTNRIFAWHKHRCPSRYYAHTINGSSTNTFITKCHNCECSDVIATLLQCKKNRVLKGTSVYVCNKIRASVCVHTQKTILFVFFACASLDISVCYIDINELHTKRVQERRRNTYRDYWKNWSYKKSFMYASNAHEHATLTQARHLVAGI